MFTAPTVNSKLHISISKSQFFDFIFNVIPQFDRFLIRAFLWIAVHTFVYCVIISNFWLAWRNRISNINCLYLKPKIQNCNWEFYSINFIWSFYSLLYDPCIQSKLGQVNKALLKKMKNGFNSCELSCWKEDFCSVSAVIWQSNQHLYSHSLNKYFEFWLCT